MATGTKIPNPRHYGSSLGHRKVVAPPSPSPPSHPHPNKLPPPKPGSLLWPPLRRPIFVSPPLASGGTRRKLSGAAILEESKKLPGPLEGGTAPKLRSCSPMSGARNHRRRKNIRPTGGRRRRRREASEWEDRERQQQLAFLREEEERLGAGVRRISVSISLVFHLSFVCPGGQGFIWGNLSVEAVNRTLQGLSTQLP